MWTTSREAAAGSALPCPSSPFSPPSVDPASSLPSLYPAVSRSEPPPLMSYQLYSGDNVDYQQQSFCQQTRTTSTSSSSTAWDPNMNSWYNFTLVNVESRRIGVVARTVRKIASRIPGSDTLWGSNWVSGRSREAIATTEVPCAGELDEPLHRLSLAEDLYQNSYSTPAQPLLPSRPHPTAISVPSGAAAMSPPRAMPSNKGQSLGERDPSGVNWDLGAQGLSIFVRAEKCQNPRVQRQIFLSGLMAMMNALPPDLSPGEMATFREMLPPGLSGCDGEEQHCLPAANSSAPEPQNWAYTVTLLMLNLGAGLYLWLAPIIQWGFMTAARLEKDHEIMKSAFCSTIATSKSVASWVIGFFPQQFALFAATYVTQGVAGATAEFFTQQREKASPVQSSRGGHVRQDDSWNSRSQFLHELQRQRA